VNWQTNSFCPEGFLIDFRGGFDPHFSTTSLLLSESPRVWSRVPGLSHTEAVDSMVA